MAIDILLFILSLFLLCIGAYLFVKGTSGLARKLHIPKLIVERLASGAHLFWSMNHQLRVS